MATAQTNQLLIKQLYQNVQKILNTSLTKSKPSYADLLRDNTHSQFFLQTINQVHHTTFTKHTLLLDRKDDNHLTLNIKDNFKALIIQAKLKTGIQRIREISIYASET